MAPEKHDLRTIRTKKALREAVIQLILERGVDKISVRDIAARAMINRATFYRHYEDKDDLLMRGMEETLLELTESMRSLPGKPSAPGPDEDLLHNLRLFFAHVEANRPFYKVMLGENGPASFHIRFARTVQDIVILIGGKTDPIEPGPLNQGVPVEVIVQFMSGSLVSMVSWWVRDDPEYTAEDMIRYYSSLVLYGNFAVLGYTPPDPSIFDKAPPIAPGNSRG